MPTKKRIMKQKEQRSTGKLSPKQRDEKEPLIERFEESVEEKASKLLEETKDDWERMGKKLYEIYTKDKEEAFELISDINRKRGERKIKVDILNKKAQRWEKLVEEGLKLLGGEGLNFSMEKSRKRTEAVLSLAAFSGIKEIKNDYDLKKAFAKVLIKEIINPYDERLSLAIDLTQNLKLYDELLLDLIIIAYHDEWGAEEKAIDTVINYDHIRDVMKDVTKKNPKMAKEIKKIILEGVEIGEIWKSYVSATLIKELGLQEEFLEVLEELLFFHDEDRTDNRVNLTAAEALFEWSPELWNEAIASDEADKRKKELKERITRGLRSWIINTEGLDKEEAINIISILGLHEKFVYELLDSLFDEDLDVVKAAIPAIRDWNEQLKNRSSSIKNIIIKLGLLNEFKEKIDEKLSNGEEAARYGSIALIAELDLEDEFFHKLLNRIFEEDESYIISTAAEIVGLWNNKLKEWRSSGVKYLEKNDPKIVNEMVEKIEVGLKSKKWQQRYAAVQLIAHLDLWEWFLFGLVPLINDRERIIQQVLKHMKPNLKERVIKRVKDIEEHTKKDPAGLTNPFTTTSYEKNREALATALFLLCI